MKLDIKNNKQYARLPVKAPDPPQPLLQPVEGAAEDEWVTSPQARAEAVGKMYHVLMGLPEPPPELEDDTMTKLSADELEALITKLWLRRQEYLKGVGADVKTEGEILEGDLKILEVLSSPQNDTEMLDILEELEYLVAQTDNARTVANLNGWPAIVRTLSASTDEVATAGAFFPLAV